MAFKKGKSGNPGGRKKGTPDKRSQLRELIKPHAAALVEKAVRLALDGGDVSALRLLIDRIIPPIKAVSEPVALAGIPTTGTLAEKIDAIFHAAATGKISIDEGQALASILRSTVDIADASTILEKLEEAENFQKGK